MLDGKFFLQMKLPTSVNFSRVELSRELDKLPDSISGEALKSLSGVDCPTVNRLGQLTTTRSIWEFDGGEVDVDKSEYFGKTDYGLEIEFTDEKSARDVLSEIKQKLEFSSDENVCVGKVRRFLQEYQNQSD